MQFALSLYQSPNLSKLDALQIDPKTTEGAWHQSWTCSGIKHCEHVHPHVLRSCREYDNVQLTEINNLRKQYHSDATPKPLFAALQRHTTSFWNAFLLNWKQEIGPCILSTGERICQGQQPELFTRNKVGIYQRYTMHMLSIYSDFSLDVPLIAMRSHGILLNLFLRQQIDMI